MLTYMARFMRQDATTGGETGGDGGQPNTGTGQGGSTALTGGNGNEANKDNGQAAPEWINSLPEELRTAPSLRNAKDLPEYVKQSLEREKLIGQKGLIKPGKDASPEQLAQYRKDAGIPEKPEGYDLKKPENWPDNVPFAEQMVPKAKELFHKYNVSAEDAKGIFNDYHEIIKEGFNSNLSTSQAEIDAGINNLKAAWGGEEQYNANVETAKIAVRQFGGDELIEVLDKTGLGNHPAMIKAFAEAGKGLREDTLEGGRSLNTGGLTPDRAKAAIEKFQSDPSKMKLLYSEAPADRTQRDLLTKEWEELHKIAYPGFTG